MYNRTKKKLEKRRLLSGSQHAEEEEEEEGTFILYTCGREGERPSFLKNHYQSWIFCSCTEASLQQDGESPTVVSVCLFFLLTAWGGGNLALWVFVLWGVGDQQYPSF